MTTPINAAATPLADALRVALTSADAAALGVLTDSAPASPRDRFATLLEIYALHTAPATSLDDAVRFQHHPAVAAIKQRCEDEWLTELDRIPATAPAESLQDPEQVVTAMRAIAARDRLPAVYRWLARSASWDEVVTFLALEGGPDAGFDDLVAVCQVGLTGSAKMELATNYWDEMGNGRPDDVHTTLHDRLVAAIDLPRVPLSEQPVTALARAAFGGLLATNRWLQPEMLGALGLIELQAGPRCRLVVKALDRCDAPSEAYPFYEVHADVDPRHGKDWLDKAIVPIVTEHPDWGARMVCGAAWRSAVNAAFLDEVSKQLGVPATVEGNRSSEAA